MGRWLREFGAALVVALSGLVLDPTFALAVPQVFLAGDVPLVGNTSRPLQPLPVLFVHGHKHDTDTSTEPHYRVTWQTALGSLPSFAQALTHPQNAGLGIEAYYIHFTDHNRSIVDDAREIGEAVELILQRHDPAYVPGDPQHPTNVQVVLIGYSKGTLSARLYLTSLSTDLSTEYGLPAPRAGFRPVSEFAAIAPPNHGLRWPLPTQSLAVLRPPLRRQQPRSRGRRYAAGRLHRRQSAAGPEAGEEPGEEPGDPALRTPDGAARRSPLTIGPSPR